MGGGASAAKSKAAAEAPKAPLASPASPPTVAPKPVEHTSGGADGETAASAIVGGNWVRPKGPSPEDDVLFEQWRAEGRLAVLEGIWSEVPYKVTVVKGGEQNDIVPSEAQELLDQVAQSAQKIFSHFDPASEASQINALPASAVHAPSEEMRKVLKLCMALNRSTRGLFDPAIKPLMDFYKMHGAAADPAQAAAVATYSNWSNFELTDTGLKKKDGNAQLDLLGIAKGWAIDEMSAKLTAAGYMASYVDWGGDIKVTGTHPAGRNWTAAVVEPPAIGERSTADHQHLAHLELRNGQSVATSGDYSQVLAPGLSHVLDPRAGRAISITPDTCASVSVVMASCMIADALATAALAAGPVKEGRRLLDNFLGASFSDPVSDYLLYSRGGPRVVRLKLGGTEDPAHREDRMQRHDPAHIIIVGGGLAGVSAAIEAAKARARVTIIEKEDQMGGNSAKATSGINACNTRVQKANGIDDDGRYFERDTHVSARGGRSDIACVSTLSDKSAEGIHWLIDELGVDLTALSQLGGHARKRTHRVPPRSDGKPVPVGYTIMQHARAVVSSMPEIEVKTRCTMKRLLKKEPEHERALPEVMGIEYEDDTGTVHQLLADAVVLTTGGFGYDHTEGSLMSEYRPDLVGVPTTNGAFADGAGIRFGRELGASIVDMDKVQLHPTAFIDPRDAGNHTKYLGPEALRGSGGILLDQQGRRFVNELDLRSVVSNKILEHCEPWTEPDGTTYRPWAWCLLNEPAQEKFGKPMLTFYMDEQGLFKGAETVEELARLMNVDPAVLSETLREYAVACDQGVCSTTGKAVFPSRMCETDQNLIVACITPCIHYCMGGLEISSNAEVLTTLQTGSVGRRAKVRRLFAAGECTGGVHGGNRLGGNSLLECVVFGRLAGERAATVKQQRPTCLDSGEWMPVTLREVRQTDKQYGHNTEVYRFNLHGAMQITGLEVGRYIAIRGELDGDTLTGYYSPVSRPEDEGIIDILIRTDEKGGPIIKLLKTLKPGSSVLMKGMGGAKLVRQPDLNIWTYQGREIQKLSLLCGGTGLAPAVQIARAYFSALNNGYTPREGRPAGIRILYAAEAAGDLAFVTAFDQMKDKYPNLLSYYLVLNTPPPGWTQGVGFITPSEIQQRLWYPPSDDHLTVMCGPPIFENIMCGTMAKLGYPREQYYSFANDPEASAA